MPNIETIQFNRWATTGGFYLLIALFKTCLNFHVCIETLYIVSYPVNLFLSGRKQPQIQHLNCMQLKIW